MTFYIASILTFVLISVAGGETWAIMLVSKQFETSIGEAITDQMRKDQWFLDEDAEHTRVVETLGSNLLSGRDERAKFAVTRSEEPGSFTLPGERILVSQGLIENTASQDELAFALGHELGHHSQQHPRKAMNELILGVLGYLLVSNQDASTQIAYLATWALVEKSVLRKREFVADRYGLELATDAGYNPQAAIELLSRFEQPRPRMPLLKLLDFHPSFEARINALQKQKTDLAAKRSEAITLGVGPERQMPKRPEAR